MTRTTGRRATRAHRCDCGQRIAPGDRYVEHVCSPNHDGLGNVGWWRLLECATCASRYGREALVAS